MYAWHVTPEQIEEAAARVGLLIRGGVQRTGTTERSSLSFVLGLDVTQERDPDGGLPYQRVSQFDHSRTGKRRRVAPCDCEPRPARWYDNIVRQLRDFLPLAIVAALCFCAIVFDVRL